MKYQCWFKIEGYLDIEADSADQAMDKYNEMTWQEIVDNMYRYHDEYAIGDDARSN